MDVTHILSNLNDAQKEAVCSENKSVLVLAGAGSGKTRVLVHRIAWLIEVERISPYQIMAVTFTNKAAREMRTRIESLLSFPGQGMWTGTFHSIAHRLLRTHAATLGLPDDFQILDAEDQLRLVKRIVKDFELDEKRYVPKALTTMINQCKDEGLRAKQVEASMNYHRDEVFVKVYDEYERICQRLGLVDFSELLLRAHELWLKHPLVLNHYQQRFQHVLVDEFQDTNSLQYAWLHMLMNNTQNGIFVVGDDDQSIYSWRGACVENVHKFRDDFSDSQLVRLEQNYRSTSIILDAANALITRNSGRVGKQLWTDREGGELIQLYSALNDQEEARFVTDSIAKLIDEGVTRSEIAVLYRSNALSRVIEEGLTIRSVPYRIYGGVRFFERAEIKDAMAYFRLVKSWHDDTSFDRVINLPTRGIGDRTMERIREHARASQVSYYESACSLLENKAFNARALSAVQAFIDLIDEMRANSAHLSLGSKMDCVVKMSGLVEYYSRQKNEKLQTRKDNLMELISAARNFEEHPETGLQEDGSEMDETTAFITHAALEAGTETQDGDEEQVQLMTLHAAKGLEFEAVFLVGVEEELFPHRLCLDSPEQIEEERRLCYVGLTRAKQKLCISFSERRQWMDGARRPSRFIHEIPAETLSNIRASSLSVKRTAMPRESWLTDEAEEQSGLHLGAQVMHPSFGLGTVLQLEGNGHHARVQVNFSDHGAKWLMLSHAKLQLLS